MSFREKSAWISLLSMAGIYGVYFWSVIRHGGGSLFGGLLGTIIAVVAVQVVLTVAVSVWKPTDANAPRDERDKLIELRSTRVAYAGLATGIAIACFFEGSSANALLFILVTAEIVRSGSQIVQYRRGA
jgi:hypothetical protein